jgi:hypothetical protein
VAIVGTTGVETPSTDETAGVDAMSKVERMDGVLDRERPAVEMSAERNGGLARTDLGEKLAYVVEGVGCAHV